MIFKAAKKVCTSSPYTENLFGFIYYFVQFCSLYVGPSIKPRAVQVDHTTIIFVVLYTILYSSVLYMLDHQSSLGQY